MMRATLWAVPAVFAVYMPTCKTPTVRWASDLLGGLTDRPWEEAFRSGGYDPAVAARFIRRLHQKIADGEQLPG